MILLFSDLLLDHNYGIGEESDQLNHLLISCIMTNVHVSNYLDTMYLDKNLKLDKS